MLGNWMHIVYYTVKYTMVIIMVKNETLFRDDVMLGSRYEPIDPNTHPTTHTLRVHVQI